MTTKAAFNAEEWAAVAAAPYLVGMLVVAADRGGTVQETMAIARAIGDARSYYTGGLLHDIVHTAPSLDPAVSPRRPDELRREAPATLRRAIATLAGVASEEEINNYKRFVFYVAEKVAHAHRHGGFLGLGGTEVSEHEQEALDEIAAILDAPAPDAPAPASAEDAEEPDHPVGKPGGGGRAGARHSEHHDQEGAEPQHQ
jgi:hypothetical protein